ncbi:hypothetical protein TWF281_010702 [Arthrobotrys megalospora]
MPRFRRSLEITSPLLNCIPLTPSALNASKSPCVASDVSRTSVISGSTSTCDWFQSEQAYIFNSKSDILGHTLHLARLAVILDKVQVYTGAARAYFDCCYVLGTVEAGLGEVELEITNQMSQSYKKRLAYLSARFPVSGRSSLSFPSHMVPALEFHIDLSPNSRQPPRLVELNRICQFLHTLGHCCEVIQEVNDQGSSRAHNPGAEALIGLSAEFQKLREDISQFRRFYSNEQLATGETRNVLFVLLESYQRKADGLVKGENKELFVFLLSLFDIKLPAEYEAGLKPLPPQPLQFKKPSFQVPTTNYRVTMDSPVSPLSLGPSIKYATTIPEEDREPIKLAPAPRKSSKRPREINEGEVRPTTPYSPDISGRPGHETTDVKINEEMEELMRGGTFLLM